MGQLGFVTHEVAEVEGTNPFMHDEHLVTEGVYVVSTEHVEQFAITLEQVTQVLSVREVT